MKTVRKGALLFLALLMSLSVLLPMAGCQRTAPEPTGDNPLLGEWKDTYGLTEYTFLDERNLTLTALGMGKFKGTYDVTDNGEILISYQVLGKTESQRYRFSFQDNRFYLDKNEFVREK